MSIQSTNWRNHLPVLVTESHAIGSIAVIRSLGRAGYPVHACSSKRDALGFRSHFAHFVAVCPPYSHGEFVPWLRAYVAENGIRAVIPSESALIEVRPAFDEFAPLFPTSRCSAIVYAGLSKFDLFQALLSDPVQRPHLPPTLLVPDTAKLPSEAELRQLGTPLFVKSDGVYAKAGDNGATKQKNDAASCLELLRSLALSFHKLLVQGTVPGQGVGAFFCLWNGEVIAEFMHRRVHEVPHTGGASSFRESWWHDDIHDHALRILKSLDWQGVAMLEYRWDAESGRFYLLEMNGRFWGSLHLMLYAGVDFPLLLMDAFHGHIPEPVRKFQLGVRCRYTFPRDVQYVWSCIKDSKLNGFRRFWSAVEFFQLTFDPKIYSDLWFPGDRRLYWYGFKNSLASFRKS